MIISNPELGTERARSFSSRKRSLSAQAETTRWRSAAPTNAAPKTAPGQTGPSGQNAQSHGQKTISNMWSEFLKFFWAFFQSVPGCP